MRAVSVAALACLVAAVVLLAGSPARAERETGEGVVGTWTLLWRYDEAGNLHNYFHELIGPERAFPIAWRRLGGGRGDRLEFYDDTGEPSFARPLEPEQEAMASPDGSTYITWSLDELNREVRRLSFYVRGDPQPLWEANAEGDPILFSSDGSVVVIASRNVEVDEFRRVRLSDRGRLQVVGADSEVRGELPIFPVFSRFTADEETIVFLHDRELLAVRRDGILAWNREVPLDNLVVKGGHVQLDTAGDLIALAGTGESPRESEKLDALHPDRRAHTLVYRTDGRRLWRQERDREGELSFNHFCVLSPDAEALATFFDTARQAVIILHDARTGDILWERRINRQPGVRSLSVAPDGGPTVLVYGDLRPRVLAWDREGKTIWDGVLPYRCRGARIVGEDLLVADHWVVRLEHRE